jgi:hypothetical protein
MIGQDDTLKETTAPVDVATKENLDNLVVIGQLLLKKDESRLNCETGQLETIEKGRTNEISLKRYGKTHKCMYVVIIYNNCMSSNINVYCSTDYR